MPNRNTLRRVARSQETAASCKQARWDTDLSTQRCSSCREPEQWHPPYCIFYVVYLDMGVRRVSLVHLICRSLDQMSHCYRSSARFVYIVHWSLLSILTPHLIVVACPFLLLLDFSTPLSRRHSVLSYRKPYTLRTWEVLSNNVMFMRKGNWRNSSIFSATPLRMVCIQFYTSTRVFGHPWPGLFKKFSILSLPQCPGCWALFPISV